MKWTEWERREYVPIGFSPLENAYRRQGLGTDNPEGRLRFLIEDILDLKESEINYLNNYSELYGRGKALSFMEGLAERYFRALGKNGMDLPWVKG